MNAKQEVTGALHHVVNKCKEAQVAADAENNKDTNFQHVVERLQTIIDLAEVSLNIVSEIS